MKLPGRVDGSFCGAVLSTRSSTGLVAASLRSNAASREPRKSRGAPPQRPASSTVTSQQPRPFSCPRSSQWLLSTFVPGLDKHRTAPTQNPRRIARAYGTAAASYVSGTRQRPQPPPPVPIQDKGKMLSYVDQSEVGSAEEYFDFYRDPYRRGYAAPDGPKLRVSENKGDVQYPSPDETAKINDGTQDVLGRLQTAIGQRLRHPTRYSLEGIYKLYCELPEPRMLCLTWQWRNRLLKVMGTPQKRDMESMLRYFALVADVKNAGLTLRRSQWNFALSFATKYTARATTQEMESALRIWKEMEKEAKIMGNDVTFNVLFDVAAKAGNFTLADMIYKEMESRGIEFNRFHHVSLIHYFGLKLDSGGVRAAYREMVESGEMIDTVVLNCVISGLLRCGEEAAAEETYQRMKNDHHMASELPQKDYMMNKVVTKVLMMFSRVGKQHPELKKSFQTNVRLTPDLHTYKLLVDHYATRVGNLQKVAQYLDEMKHLKIAIEPTIFLALFKGFYMHGGFAGSDWSEQRLEGVLAAFYQAHDEHAKEFRIDRWVVIWALRAVKKCCSNEALVQTFESMSQRWDVKPDRQQFMHALFENILHNKDLKSTRGDGLHQQRRKKDSSWL
ncbi:pentatricopeptide repeat containing [Trichoderma arundinaceum]|uniref:Pentatricopeptide repeat containing n=1 Tax=Trichoderma arundinaceum TaxID=490622 RepID=A0A395P0Y0_TRIAR|nr:pentatricopeptide repeat containing [Trichoderma arundinaceum]